MVGSLKLKERLDTELPNTCPRSDTSEPPPPPEDDWLIPIEEKLKRARQYDAAGSGSKINIYRVPQRLRDRRREKAYIPQVVSLGPYHHGNKLLQPMELHKGRALNNVLKRNNQSLELYLDSMKELEDRARACYEGPLKLMSSDEFAEMMVLDGCFVLELFHGYADGFEKLGYAWNDPVFSVRGAITLIVLDMIMLENQIPLIVLGKLFELLLPDHMKDRSEHEVAWLAIQFFDSLMQTGRDCKKYDLKSDEVGLHCLDVFRKYLLSKRPDNVQSSTRDSTTCDPQFAKDGLHCLHVFRKYLLSKWPDNVQSLTTDSTTSDPKGLYRAIYCATDLKDAGIKFRKRKTDRLWDIRFNNGVLDIPPILIQDCTESLLHNLIAFEQCHLIYYKRYITDYVFFLDDLINSEEDVRYLRRHKIIDNWLGSDLEVPDLVHSLCQEVISGRSYSKLYEEINEYSDRKRNIWWATLMQKYFNNPWAILSLVAAVFLLLMAAAQTFYTVYPYYLPRK